MNTCAIKSMNKANLQQVYNHLNDFWDKTCDHSNCQTGNELPIPKLPNSTYLNKNHIITLMDLCSKDFSRILCARSYKLLEKYGTKHQYHMVPHRIQNARIVGTSPSNHYSTFNPNTAKRHMRSLLA